LEKFTAKITDILDSLGLNVAEISTLSRFKKIQVSKTKFKANAVRIKLKFGRGINVAELRQKLIEVGLKYFGNTEEVKKELNSFSIDDLIFMAIQIKGENSDGKAEELLSDLSEHQQ